MVVPVVLCGGVGSRLWPLSTNETPKQFAPVLGDLTLLEQTLARFGGPGFDAPLLIGSADHRLHLERAMRSHGDPNTHALLEPVRRNTGAAVAAAVAHFRRRQMDPLLLFTPADHSVDDDDLFIRTILRSAHHADRGKLVLFGVRPTRVDAGLGYIVPGDPLPCGGCGVRRFVEKPRYGAARDLIEREGALWNSGMCLGRASVYEREIKTYAPDMWRAAERAVSESDDGRMESRLSSAFELAPNVSFDHAVLECVDGAVIEALEVAWSDLGTWIAIRDFCGSPTTPSREGPATAIEAEGSFVVNDTKKRVHVLGAGDTAVIVTENDIVVLNLDRHDLVKDAAAQAERAEALVAMSTG